MKKLTIILFLFLPVTLIAQKFVIIPDGQEKPFQKVLLTWHDGIDAVQVKDLTWVIAESDYKRLPVTLTVTKTEIVDLKSTEVVYNIKTELNKLPVKILVPTDFKVVEAIKIEPIEKIILK